MAETATLKVGDEAPDFELPMSPTGEKFKLSDYRGKNAVIINFVPAAFSPVCSNQLPLIEKNGVLIESRGIANRVVIVVDKHGKVAWIQPTEKITDIPDYDPVVACAKG